MLLGQTHCIPVLQSISMCAVTPSDVFLIRAAVIKQVEFDEFHTLVFEIEECPVDATPIRAQVASLMARTWGLTPGIASGPVALPVDPRSVAPCHCFVSSSAAGRILLDFAKKALRAFLSHPTKAPEHICRTAPQVCGGGAAASSEEQQHTYQHRPHFSPH